MAKFKVTEKDIELLELKTDLAYQMLKRAVETQPLLIPSAECLYWHDVGERLGKGIPSFRKGGKRAKPIERFILQYLLMHKVDSDYDDGHYQTLIVPDADDGIGGLKAYLDADDDPHSERSELFKLIQNRSADLRKENRYDLILKALDYVREKYKKS